MCSPAPSPASLVAAALSALVAPAALAGGVAAQQHLLAPAPLRAGEHGPLGPGPNVHSDQLCLKVADAVDVALVDGVLQSRRGCDLGGVMRALGAQARLVPMVPGVSRAQLDALYARACERLPAGARPGHMAHWFYVECAAAAVADRLLAELPAQPFVEHCYRRPIFTPASAGVDAAPRLPLVSPPLVSPPPGGDPAPPTPLFHHLQQTLDDPPLGTGLRWANGILGARGRGVKLRMVEVDWFYGHEDIARLRDASLFMGAPPQGTAGISLHGTAGASLIIADRNDWGMVGAADEVDVRFLAYPLNGGLVNGVLTAAVDIGEGDVIMMVLMFLLGQYGADDWVPSEFLQAEFDAVLTTTVNDRIVVASAANGGRSLDDPRLFRRFDRTFRDSGAIFVGATDGSAPARASFCNYGSVVDANCWGSGVVTVGYGTLFHGNGQLVQSYTQDYRGTSASVPVVTSLVAALQGAGERQLGRVFTNLELRQLLRTHGTPVAGAIGRRPDARAMFAATGILDGLEVATGGDVRIGGSVAITVSDPAPTGAAVLFTSLGTGTADLGFNRPLHLDLGSTQTFGFGVLQNGAAAFTLPVPNEPLLHGLHLYLQAAVADGAGPVHVTNSAHVTVL